MFKSWGSALGFLAGLGLTVGLLLSPYLLPWGWGEGLGLHWSAREIAFAAAAGLFVLAASLFIAGRLVKGAESWKQGRVIGGAVLIAAAANTLFSLLVEFFSLRSGWRALVAVLGVPVIYGNLGAVLGRTSLKNSMLSIFTSALATMGAGLIIAAIIRGWA